MTIHLHQLNRAGLCKNVIIEYQNTNKCKRFINTITTHYYPPIKLYKNTNTLADGIHRLCAQLYHGILEFEFEYQ